MTSDLIFITQMASIIGYIGTVFILYRILIKQKDATIDLLKNRISMLEQHLSTGRDYDQQRISLLEKELLIAKEQDPDILLKKYKERLDLATEELSKIETDMSKNLSDINDKEKEIAKIREELKSMGFIIQIQKEHSEFLLDNVFRTLESSISNMPKVTYTIHGPIKTINDPPRIDQPSEETANVSGDQQSDNMR